MALGSPGGSPWRGEKLILNRCWRLVRGRSYLLRLLIDHELRNRAVFATAKR